mmetsp:Transcript_52942/g.115808  ORF Transcript_52942/g.115808 Transcript_52942/m.115808 type:complete len:107 (+) Transcript_52942:2216-2536(+)
MSLSIAFLVLPSYSLSLSLFLPPLPTHTHNMLFVQIVLNAALDLEAAFAPPWDLPDHPPHAVLRVVHWKLWLQRCRSVHLHASSPAACAKQEYHFSATQNSNGFVL